MRAGNLLVGAGALVLLGLSYLFEPVLLGTDSIPESALTGPEALQWLEANRNASGLASNRFGTTREALEFVKTLYASGAEAVFVSQETITDDPDTINFEGGPYADALVVKLPTDPAARERVQGICRRELRREGFDLDGATEGESIFLWWD